MTELNNMGKDNNAEGVQNWKGVLLQKVGHKKLVVDLGSGVTIPYLTMLKLHLSPEYIYFVDIQFNGDSESPLRGYDCIDTDAIEFLNRFEDGAIPYLWASEFFEHISPDEQVELLELITRKAQTFMISFPTIDHPNFHNDWTHRPVMIPHYRMLLNQSGNAWEGIITNDQETLAFLQANFTVTYDYRPSNRISRARYSKMGREGIDK